MRRQGSRYAPQIAIAGAILILVALGAWLVMGYLVTWSQIVGAAGLVLLAVASLLRPDAVRRALGARQARYGGNAVVMTLALVGVLVLVNYLADRHTQRWDVTAEKQFSLSEQTYKILDALSEPVAVKLFFTPGHYYRSQAEQMIKEYAARSSRLTYQMIDPETQRLEAMEYGISRDGTIVFERGERREVTYGVQEQDLTSALLKVTRDEATRVYFATGHQERDTKSSDGTGLDSIRQQMESENYQVDTWNPATGQSVPEDAAVLVIAGARTEYAAQEIEAIQSYVAQGGCLLVLSEPGYANPLGDLLEPYGVALEDNVVIDPAQGFFGDIVTPLVSEYTYHQITKDLTGASTIFPTVRALTLVDPAPADWTVTVLARSSADSWAETAYTAEQVQHDEGEASGPLALMAAIEPQGEPDGRGRLVVVGDTDLVSNDVLNAVRGIANADLFMNALGWLAAEEELISIRPVEYVARTVTLTSPQSRAVVYSNILFVPLVVLLAGGLVWWRRR